ncbi:MAG: hypothetical protein R3Y36_05950 [Spirochaetales bacterium]
MNTIETRNLKEGMKFSAPVFFDDGKNMFLAEGMPITKFHLQTIAGWKIATVVTSGNMITEKSDNT